MSMIFFTIKILFYCLFGSLLFKLIEPNKKSIIKGFSPFYGIFSLISIASDAPQFIVMVITGIFWALLLRIFFDVIDKRLSTDINPVWFGLLNIFNHYILEAFFDRVILSLNHSLATLIFVVGTVYFLISMSYTLRNSLWTEQSFGFFDVLKFLDEKMMMEPVKWE